MINIPENTKNQYKAYEREIQVFGNLYCAKKRISNNLMPITYGKGTYRGITATANGNVFRFTGTWDGNDGGPEFSTDFTLPAGTYTFNINKVGNSIYPYLVFGVDDNTTFRVVENECPKTITFDSDTHIIRFWFYFNYATYNDQYKIMINEGTEALPFEENGCYVNDYNSFGTSSSKNLFNKDDTVNANFYASGEVVYDTDFFGSDYIPVTNRDITISGVLNDSYSNLMEYNENKGVIDYWNARNRTIRLNSNTRYIRVAFHKSNINTAQVEYGTEATSYERGNSKPFKLTEENECKILSFNINEKTDPYYTSLPYNEMDIEVDNEKGYFTDYDVDNILNKLNKDCYVDLFMKINNDDYYKIMTMQFDKLSSSDYEKATLSFKSNISLLKSLPLRDINNIFATSTNINKNDLKKYFVDNYKLNLVCDNNTNDIMYKLGYTNVMTVESILLHSGTKYGTLEKAVLTLNDTQDNIVQRTWKKEPQDTILLDYQAEKPIVKREDVFRGLHRKYIRTGNWNTSTDTFNYILSGKLTTNKESIILFNYNYALANITNSDITVSGNVSVNVVATTAYEALNIIISGNVNDEYTITINKPNMTKKTTDNYGDETIGSVDDTTKILDITEIAPLQSGYYQFILSEKQIKSNIEAQIFGLPYLEIGDTVEIETENARILMTITEIDMNYNGGLLEIVKGYELGWDALFPSDTLYPDDELYPNTPIN